MPSFQKFKQFTAQQIAKVQPIDDSNPDERHKQNSIQEAILQSGLNSQKQGIQIKNKSANIVRKSNNVCNFISKIYQMLQNKQLQTIVSWVEWRCSFASQNSIFLEQTGRRSSNSFQILNVSKFEDIVLPMYFKHSNMSSFIRQLNMYGFHKLRGQKGQYQFQNQKFIRDRKDLLGQIKRKNPQFINLSTGNIVHDKKNKRIQHHQSQGNISLILIPSQINIPLPNENISSKQIASENIFASECFFKNKVNEQKNKSIKIQSSQNLRLKRIQQLQEQNNLLKKIKQQKLQKIKQINFLPKSLVQIKFSKIIYTFLAQKFAMEERKLLQQRKSIQNINGPNVDSKLFNVEQNKSIFHSIEDFVEHIFNNNDPQSFKQYKKGVRNII